MMKPYVKTKEDINKENWDIENNPVLIYLKYRKDQTFKVGDVLIKLIRGAANQWTPETTGWSTTGSIKKFLYAFENEIGIGYVKQYKSDGSLSNSAHCMTEFDAKNCKFELDPDYADHIMLSNEGESFDPTKELKAKKLFREKAIKNNKKLILSRNPADVLNWTNSLKVGDEFYAGHSVPDMVKKKFKVKSYKAIEVSKIDHYERERIKKIFPVRDTDIVRQFVLEVIKHTWQDKGSVVTWDLHAFDNTFITQKEPFPLMEGGT